MKLILIKLFIFLANSPLYAQEVLCNQINQPQVSELKISYDILGEPQGLYLRSPKATEFRPLNFVIEVVTPLGMTGHETFSAKPQDPVIDWSQETECFKEVGTLMYFLFWHSENKFFVELYPYYVTQSKSCVTPRVQTQLMPLECHRI